MFLLIAIRGAGVCAAGGKKPTLRMGCHVQKPPVVERTTGCMGPVDVLHHFLRTAIARLRTVHCVAFLANSPAIGLVIHRGGPIGFGWLALSQRFGCSGRRGQSTEIKLKYHP
jgi:hypothetical protein